jgi:pimeloyl-ACP methyl ester carboxylesterase
MMEILRDAVREPYWDAWSRIACPTLLVRADNGVLSTEDARAMVERLPSTQLEEIVDANHDVHLDRPAEWRQVLSQFLQKLP